MPWDCWGDEWIEPLKPEWWTPRVGNRVRIVANLPLLLGAKATVIRQRKLTTTILPDLWARAIAVESCSIVRVDEPDVTNPIVPAHLDYFDQCDGAGKAPTAIQKRDWMFRNTPEGLCPECHLWYSLNSGGLIGKHGSVKPGRAERLIEYVADFIQTRGVDPPFYVFFGGLLPPWKVYEAAGLTDYMTVILRAKRLLRQRDASVNPGRQ